ncbi:anti-sigma factor [Catenuloplanes japonicus]|uniref:hypothetical protein n=1 Tax=Catenuloplanes japonicus TaxID=33876 RepID=UPI000526EDFD|nr:hypothetical protein [Catenuloplanes japonicus]
MSSSDASLTEAQWDLLADYLGGALDGDPRRDEIAGLIESDPEWREAHTLLAEADDAVRDDLRLLAEAPVEPMPDDVFARLLPTNVIPMRRRVPRWVLPATIAAGVLAFASVGITGLLGGDESSSDVASSAGGAAPEAAALPMIAEQILISGRDYTPESAQELGTAPQALSSPMSASGQDAPSVGRDGSVPDELFPLQNQSVLRACLRAIGLEHGAVAATVRLIDYASFEGGPSLLVLFTDTAGQDVVWVSGPQCGAAGMGADTRYRTPVG